jgi:lipopolysaccharide export LptBFGC system permease protein LptF
MQVAELTASPPESGALARPVGVSWTLTRHLAVEILKLFVFALAIIELLYGLFIAAGVARRLNLHLILVFPVFWTTALSVLNDTAPLALLFATALVYGRYIADREVMAMKGFGLSYGQLLLPVLILGGFFLLAGYFITGFVCPEMNYRQRNIAGLLVRQLRYLGEGWNRDLSYLDQNLWILHHNGRELHGIFLSPPSKEATMVLSEEVSRRINPLSYPFHLFAERGEILFAEDLEERRRKGAENAASPHAPPGAVVFELHNVWIYFADEIIRKDQTPFDQRAHLDRFYVVFDPAKQRQSVRRSKHKATPELVSSLHRNAAALGRPPLAAADRAALESERRELLTEYHGRWEWIISFLLYPMVAGVLALLLNSENRLLPFFSASLLAPLVFYGSLTIGRLLSQAGFPPWLVLHGGSALLGGFALAGFWLLEKRVLR